MAAKRQSQLAVTLFTLRDFCNLREDIVRTLARVRKIGYENVQISGGGLMAVHPPDLARMVEDAGLRIIGSHIALAMFRDVSTSVCSSRGVPFLPTIFSESQPMCCISLTAWSWSCSRTFSSFA